MSSRGLRVAAMTNTPPTSAPVTPLPTTENPLPRPLTEKERFRDFVQARVGPIPVKLGGLKSRRRTRRRRSRKTRRSRK